MNLKIIHSTPNCQDTACPTVYQDAMTGNLVFQGYNLDPEDLSKMNIPKGENAVIMPAEFIQSFIHEMKQEGFLNSGS